MQMVSSLGKIDTKKWMGGVKSGREAGREETFLLIFSTSKKREVEMVDWEGVLTALPISARITFTIGKRDDLKTHRHGFCQLIRVKSSENVQPSVLQSGFSCLAATTISILCIVPHRLFMGML